MDITEVGHVASARPADKGHHRLMNGGLSTCYELALAGQPVIVVHRGPNSVRLISSMNIGAGLMTQLTADRQKDLGMSSLKISHDTRDRPGPKHNAKLDLHCAKAD